MAGCRMCPYVKRLIRGPLPEPPEHPLKTALGELGLVTVEKVIGKCKEECDTEAEDAEIREGFGGGGAGAVIVPVPAESH